MAYQLGVEGVAKFVLMLTALERGDRETAAVNALASEWAKQTPDRAKRVATLIRGHEPEGDD
jgi:lysozyme